MFKIIHTIVDDSDAVFMVLYLNCYNNYNAR